MVRRLFVYGTLGPGRPNAHVLEDIGGSWQPATVNGRLRSAGWGAEQGFPGIDLDDKCDPVAGYIFSSAALADHWNFLDAFEGAEYERTTTVAALEDGSRVEVFVYRLRSTG